MKKNIIIIALALFAGIFILTGCGTLKKAFVTESEHPVANADGTPALTADGKQIFESTVEPKPVVKAVLKGGESLPAPFGWIFAGISAVVAGVCEGNRRRYVKNADGTITLLEEKNQTLTSALNALAVARDQLWDKLDQIDGGQKVIDWFDEFAKNNAVDASQKVLNFITDTLAKAETPDKAVSAILTKLESAA